MKIEDVLRIDCRDEENKKFLVERFKKIPYIQQNLENPKDLKELKEVTRELVDREAFTYNTLFHHEHRYYTLAVYDDKLKKPSGDRIIYTLYALDKREIYLKLCVFCYYLRKKQKKDQNK